MNGRDEVKEMSGRCQETARMQKKRPARIPGLPCKPLSQGLEVRQIITFMRLLHGSPLVSFVEAIMQGCPSCNSTTYTHGQQVGIHRKHGSSGRIPSR